MSPEAKNRAIVLTAGTLIPLGSLSLIFMIAWYAAGVIKTVEANQAQIRVLTEEQAQYRKDVTEIKVNVATLLGAQGFEYQKSK